ncbi:hypothetical protein SS50377_23893 [Spironucleus salmonicida]|uniref:Uncharacterized protein n=1 Tax=Spironucleus salmonicida TaxID=348837 RepID=V6LUJ5_9EUKA|nr:hypothetical protein SS50377_23877 [Spironucleus salmonicida]KAH0573958.1 hypothetical protein SS50377_23893 [Spironucleus salmonicida]|eukprot:EST48297.1 Hypothetical protein SS50377_11496 [Spironucleus salmonicida]
MRKRRLHALHQKSIQSIPSPPDLAIDDDLMSLIENLVPTQVFTACTGAQESAISFARPGSLVGCPSRASYQEEDLAE